MHVSYVHLGVKDVYISKSCNDIAFEMKREGNITRVIAYICLTFHEDSSAPVERDLSFYGSQV